MKRCIESDKEGLDFQKLLCHLPRPGICSPTQKLSYSQVYGGFAMQCCLSSQSLAPLLSPEDGEQGLKVPSFKSWLGLSSGQHSSIRPVGVTSLRQNMLPLPRIYQGFRSSVPGNRIKHQILKQRMLQALLLFYSYQEMTRVLGDLGQELRIEMDTLFPLVYRMKLASIVQLRLIHQCLFPALGIIAQLYKKSSLGKENTRLYHFYNFQ